MKRPGYEREALSAAIAAAGRWTEKTHGLCLTRWIGGFDRECVKMCDEIYEAVDRRREIYEYEEFW